jgi:hypothetical protein
MHLATSQKTTAFARLVTVGLAVVFLLIAAAFSGFAAPHSAGKRAEIKAPVQASHAHLGADFGTADLAEDDEVASSLPPIFAPLSLFASLLLPAELQQPTGFQRRFFTQPLRLHLLVGVLLI